MPTPLRAGIPAPELEAALRLNESELLELFTHDDDPDVEQFGRDVRRLVGWALACHRAIAGDLSRETPPLRRTLPARGRIS